MEASVHGGGGVGAQCCTRATSGQLHAPTSSPRFQQAHVLMRTPQTLTTPSTSTTFTYSTPGVMRYCTSTEGAVAELPAPAHTPHVGDHTRQPRGVCAPNA